MSETIRRLQWEIVPVALRHAELYVTAADITLAVSTPESRDAGRDPGVRFTHLTVTSRTPGTPRMGPLPPGGPGSIAWLSVTHAAHCSREMLAGADGHVTFLSLAWPCFSVAALLSRCVP